MHKCEMTEQLSYPFLNLLDSRKMDRMKKKPLEIQASDAITESRIDEVQQTVGIHRTRPAL